MKSANCSLPSMRGLCHRLSLTSTLFLSGWKMDWLSQWRDNARMAKKAAKRRKWQSAHVRTLHLGQWLRALDVKPADIARGIGCSEAYLSNLINGKTEKNPSTEFMLDLSEFLGLGINDLFDPPPPAEEVEKLGKLNRGQWAAFLEVLAMRTRKK